MSRQHDPKQLSELADLARLKEMVTMAEVSRRMLDISELDRQMSELKSRAYSAETPEEARYLERWQMWRKQKLRQLGMERARLEAIHLEASLYLSRLSAEKAVLEDLFKRACKMAEREKARRASYVS